MPSFSGDVPPKLPESTSPSLRSQFGSVAREASKPGSGGAVFLQEVRSSSSYRDLRGMVNLLAIFGSVVLGLGIILCIIALLENRWRYGGPSLLIQSLFYALGVLVLQLMRRGVVLLADMADVAIWHGRKASSSGQDFVQQLRSSTSYGALRRLLGFFLARGFSWPIVISLVLLLLTWSWPGSLLVALVIALCVLLLTVTNHVAIMLVDMADLVIWHGSRSTKDRS